MMGLYCHKTMGERSSKMVTTATIDLGKPMVPTPVYVVVQVQDPTTGRGLPGASVTAIRVEDSSTVTVTTDTKGIALVPVTSNGRYKVIIDSSSHIETVSSFDMTCYGKSVCTPEVSFQLAPQIKTPGDVRVLATWSGMDS